MTAPATTRADRLLRRMIPPTATEPPLFRAAGDFSTNAIIPYPDAARWRNRAERNFRPVRGLRLHARRPAPYRAVPGMRPPDRRQHRGGRAHRAGMGGRYRIRPLADPRFP